MIVCSHAADAPMTYDATPPVFTGLGVSSAHRRRRIFARTESTSARVFTFASSHKYGMRDSISRLDSCLRYRSRREASRSFPPSRNSRSFRELFSAARLLQREIA